MFQNFIGNEDLKETVLSAVRSGRFPHAFILEGEEGSGRHTLARIIAAAAVCQSEDAPCGSCRECELIKKDGLSDVLTYKPDGATFKVDLVRQIRENAFVLPIESKRKVNILLDCDKMNESAQNAFLKILEEPPSFMVFILICRNASALLTTVRSRCVTLTLKNPETEDAANFILKQTGKPEADIKEALLKSHGNVGKALSILDGSESGSKAKAEEFYDACLKNDRFSAVKIMQAFEKDRLGLFSFMDELDLILKHSLKQIALGDLKLPRKMLANAAKITEEYRFRLKEHIGPPLSLPIFCTAFVAEIFG
jgi:DNA polymerase-3 subunit delta'